MPRVTSGSWIELRNCRYTRRDTRQDNTRLTRTFFHLCSTSLEAVHTFIMDKLRLAHVSLSRSGLFLLATASSQENRGQRQKTKGTKPGSDGTFPVCRR